MKRMFIIAGVVFALDQVSKFLVVQVMDLPSGDIALWPPFVTFVMAWNYGINFGLLAGDSPVTRWALIFVALVITFWVSWWMRRETRVLPRFAAGLLIGGALGNVVDRLVYGAVADFINMSCCGISNPFAFNLADVWIFAGAFGLIFLGGTKKPS